MLSISQIDYMGQENHLFPSVNSLGLSNQRRANLEEVQILLMQVYSSAHWIAEVFTGLARPGVVGQAMGWREKSGEPVVNSW